MLLLVSLTPAALDPGSSRTAIWCSLGLILFVSVMFNSTFIHYGLNRIDESWQLYAAMRLHAGGTLYKDVMVPSSPASSAPRSRSASRMP